MNLQHIQTFEKSFTCPVQWHRFDNGPDVIVAERPSNFVVVQVTVPVGALCDLVPGTAHALEHAKMKGQMNEDGVHPRLLELSFEGVDGNAGTSHEFTEFYLSGPVLHCRRMLEVVASIVFESHFESSQVIRERGSIEQEYAETERDHRFDRWRMARFISGSGFEKSIIGTPDSIRRVDVPCLSAFDEKWYGWNRASVIVAGGVEASAVHGMLPEIIEQFPKSSDQPRLAFEVADAHLGRYEYIGDDISTPGIEVNFPNAGPHTRDGFILGIIAEILDFPRIGLLPNELRGKRRMVYDVGVSHVSFPHRVFSVQAQLDPSKFEDYTNIVHDCVAKIANDAYPDHLLYAIFRHRQILRLRQSESSDHGSCVDSLRDDWLHDDRDDQDYLEWYEKTSREDISRVAKKYLQNVKWGSIIRLPK